MNKIKSRYNTMRKWLIFWTLFIGVGAVVGSVSMFAAPGGEILHMESLLPCFQVLPFADVLFRDYLFSGVALLIVNGLTNLTAAALLFAKKKNGVILGGIFGVTLMLWICIQFVIFEFNALSTSYFVFGLCQAITGYAAWVFLRQEEFSVNESDYPSIGSEPKRLVVYFSRMGYTKKAAFEEANRTGADILELKTTEKTEGTSGFWWCGRFAMHRWGMPLAPIEKDITQYDHVTICTPIWVFALSAPVRSFLNEKKDKIAEADLISVHFTKWKNNGALHEAEEILQKKLTAYKSICCRFGKIKQK